MSVKSRISRLIPAWLLIFCAPSAFADPEKTVTMELQREGDFRVLYSRAKSAATGAVIGGLIGAGIEEGVRTGKDESREKAVLAHLPDSSCHKVFVSSLRERLANRPELLLTEGERSEEANLVLQVKINQCGFKLSGSDSDKVAAFVEAKYRLYPSSAKKPRKMDRLFVLGKHRMYWHEVVADGVLARAEFEKALEAGGKRLANKIVYYKG